MRLSGWFLMLSVGIACMVGGIVLLLAGSSCERDRRDQGVEASGGHGAQKKLVEGSSRQGSAEDRFAETPKGAATASVRGVRPGKVVVAIEAELDREEEAASPDVAEAPKEKATSEKLIAEVKAGWDKKELTTRLKELMQEIQDEGGDVVGILVSLYQRDGSVQERTVVINALKELGSTAARDALLGLALNPGRDSATLGPRAARAFAALTENSSQISRLMDSPLNDVKNAAAEALANRVLTQEAVDRLGKLLASDSWGTHGLVATAFSTDKSPETAAEKVAYLLSSSKNLHKLKDAWKVHPEMGLSRTEFAYSCYITAMANMRGADDILKGSLEQTSGRSRKMVVIALAQRKHAGVRAELLGIIQTDKLPIMRTRAVCALLGVATKEDIPLLQRISETDPFKREDHHRRHTDGSPTIRYPVRDAAKTVLSMLESQK